MPRTAADPARSGRARPSHALRNDDAIRDAATTVIARSGWDAATIAGIADAAGVTHGALYGRHANKAELGAALWRETLLPALREQLAEAIDAGLRSDDVDRFGDAMRRFVAPDDATRAALELVLAAPFDRTLGSPIIRDARRALAATSTPGLRLPPQDAARALAVGLHALGYVLTADSAFFDDADDRDALAALHAAIRTPAWPMDLPEIRADYIAASPFDTGDPRVDGLLAATVRCVGEVGYHDASVARICRTAGVSQGFLFNRYPTKFDLFRAAIELQRSAAMRDTDAFIAEVAATHGNGIAEAVAWREHQRPEFREQRTIVLESLRLARHDERMRDVIDDSLAEAAASRLGNARGPRRAALLGHMRRDYAVGIGLVIVGNVLPDAWKLPFDAVTIGLNADVDTRPRRKRTAGGRPARDVRHPA